MTKLERAIEALEALPQEQQDAIADMVLELIDLSVSQTGESTLTDEQIAEIDRRRARGFRPADPSRIDRLLARLR